MMKKLCLVIVVLFILALASFGYSQQRRQPSEAQHNRHEQLLTTDQLEGAMFRAIIRVFLARLNEVRAKQSPALPPVTEAQIITDLRNELGPR